MRGIRWRVLCWFILGFRSVLGSLCFADILGLYDTGVRFGSCHSAWESALVIPHRKLGFEFGGIRAFFQRAQGGLEGVPLTGWASFIVGILGRGTLSRGVTSSRLGGGLGVSLACLFLGNAAVYGAFQALGERLAVKGERRGEK